MIATFTLVDTDGVASGNLDLTLDDGSVLTGIAVDLLTLARNDPSALRFSPGTAVADDLAAALLPHLRMLVRGGVVPLHHVIPSLSRDSYQA
jgi:hypothetical protein